MSHAPETHALRSLIEEVRAMRPSTDVNRLSMSREHREDELGRLAYRHAINDVLDRIATRVNPPEAGRS